MSASGSAATPRKTTVFGVPVDEKALVQINTCMEDERAVAGALMADHHMGYSMPIGGVVAYGNAVSPSGVGFDIACGNKAALTNLALADLAESGGEAPSRVLLGLGGDGLPQVGLKNEASVHAYSSPLSARSVMPLLREIQRQIAFGIGRTNDAHVETDLFDDPLWGEIEHLVPGLKHKAYMQLGTVGSGNHYVDLLADTHGRVWVANHFGSRGFGHTIATAFLNLAKNDAPGARLKESETPTVLDLDTDTGAFYFAAMELAGRYAYAGRDYVLED